MENKYKRVLVIGSGAIKIGQAGEFDYSGSQAIKALKEEGIFTILVNPNIATIQTSEAFADKIYFLPVEEYYIEKIIQKEKPDGVFLSFGGQTALNIGLQLHENNVFEKYGVEILGTSVEAIKTTEDRALFNQAIEKMGYKVPISKPVTTVDDALKTANEIGFPVMIRIAYALGGLGSGIVHSEPELKTVAKKALTHAPQILIEENLTGWKELEYEVVRDTNDNCIVVCSMENLDPMGVHTGESIVTAPIQTLSANEVFELRAVAIDAIRKLGIIGECNIQYAFSREKNDYRIIEVNPRLSRSSALASKATGYPLAYIAAKLALGYTLPEIQNTVTKTTTACFEPAIDYVVVKIPRWDLSKFQNVHPILGSEMKSVGEVMSIGRTFEEALQKALRMLDIGVEGVIHSFSKTESLEYYISNPNEKRLLAIAEAFQEGYSIEKIHSLSAINEWFLQRIKNIVDTGKFLENNSLETLPQEKFLLLKQFGFSDKYIANFYKIKEEEVRKRRKKAGIVPYVKQIDTLAAEFPATTNYLYMTYMASAHDISFNDKKQVIVLGSGTYRIGCSVEFDWCCVNCSTTLQKMGYSPIMINYNPETVSTDYDLCDKLFFEELSFERVLDIYELEKPTGIVVSMGGQIANNLVLPLSNVGANILGTPSKMIDTAEDRNKFSQLLDTLEIHQPEWAELTTLESAETFAQKVGFPVLIRPSYVLSGAAMSIALNKNELVTYLQRASEIDNDHPVVISKFIENSKEVDVDAVAKDGEILACAISLHLENAGVHSGDATLILPPNNLYLETIKRIEKTCEIIAKKLQITGPFNIQFLAKNNELRVIECNLRASRSFPFVSKVFKENFIALATKAIMGEEVKKIETNIYNLKYHGVKASQFSFTRLKGSDPVQTVEMTSTGEVGCLGDSYHEALYKSVVSVGMHPPQNKKTILLSTGTLQDKVKLLGTCKLLSKKDYNLYATKGTAKFLRENNIETSVLHWPKENKEPNVTTLLKEKEIELVINIPKNTEEKELENDYLIRRTAVDFNVPVITNVHYARQFVEMLVKTRKEDMKIKSWDEY